jgi:hypothetical protein
MAKPVGGNPKVDDSTEEKDTPPDDNSQEEESEESVEEETDDSTDEEEEDEEEESEEDSEEDDEEEEEDISQKYFTDPASLPKEVRGAFKKMQGIYTRKMQEASSVIDKAEAFDEMIKHPQIRAIVEGKPVQTKADEEEDEVYDDDKPLTKKTLVSLLDRVIEQKLAPDRKARMSQAVEQEVTEFKKNNPDWEIYKPVMRDILKNTPNLPLQDALDLAKLRSQGRKVRLTKEELDAKKRASKTRKSGAGGPKKVEKEEKVNSFQDAFKKARKQILGR